MISIGPFVLALERLGALVALGLFLVGSKRIERRFGGDAERRAFIALLSGVLAARAGYALANWAAFRHEPLSILAFWQGGFSWIWGIIATVILLILTMRRSQALTPMIALLAGITVLWFAADRVLLTPTPRPFPPNILVTPIDGATVTPGQLQGRPFVINLWATWCPPCQREMPMMVEEAARASLPVLLVNQGEDRATVEAWLRTQGLPDKAILLDPQSTASARLESGALPTTLFVDANGMIRMIHRGEISRAGLLSAIRELDRP